MDAEARARGRSSIPAGVLVAGRGIREVGQRIGSQAHIGGTRCPRRSGTRRRPPPPRRRMADVGLRLLPALCICQCPVGCATGTTSWVLAVVRGLGLWLRRSLCLLRRHNLRGLTDHGLPTLLSWLGLLMPWQFAGMRTCDEPGARGEHRIPRRGCESFRARPLRPDSIPPRRTSWPESRSPARFRRPHRWQSGPGTRPTMPASVTCVHDRCSRCRGRGRGAR